MKSQKDNIQYKYNYFKDNSVIEEELINNEIKNRDYYETELKKDNIKLNNNLKNIQDEFNSFKDDLLVRDKFIKNNSKNKQKIKENRPSTGSNEET